MDSGTLFNRLWVIESLPQGNLKTGKSLVEHQLVGAKCNHSDPVVENERPRTKQELQQLLQWRQDSVLKD